MAKKDTTPHEPTKERRDTVSLHASVGTPQELIARVLGIDAKTLRKYYRDELDLSLVKANATIGGALFNKARGGDTGAQCFWMKTRAGWKETVSTEVFGKDGGPIQTEDVSARDIIADRLARLAAAASAAKDTGKPD